MYVLLMNDYLGFCLLKNVPICELSLLNLPYWHLHFLFVETPWWSSPSDDNAPTAAAIQGLILAQPTLALPSTFLTARMNLL